MGNDDPAMGFLAVFRQDAGNEFVRQAVKAVALDALGAERARNGEGLGDSRVGAVKGGVETGYLTDFRQQLGDGLDAVEVVRLVQRGERDELFKLADRVRADRHRGREQLAAMDDAVADSDQFGAGLVFLNPGQQEVERGLVLGFLFAAQLQFDFVLAVRILGDQFGAGADAVDLAGQAGFVGQAAIQFVKRKLDR